MSQMWRESYNCGRLSRPRTRDVLERFSPAFPKAENPTKRQFFSFSDISKPNNFTFKSNSPLNILCSNSRRQHSN
ncbi:hypothetical protein CEXT_501461 [Caerostris extrusa]|uniref:Ycf15 n=1 Tax=Caerostris extrusa TaxID=172846 RepID=A0AAV4RL27_CAEEX|nr:hypothetical protein CEXT_501461 [Caerostris extrusa]